MKKTTLFMIAAAVVALSSCSKAEISAPQTESGKHLSINVGLETKSSLQSDGSVKWLKDDPLIVFDENNTAVKFTTTTSNVATATFTTESWTGKAPKYAVSLYDEDAAACTSDGVISVCLRDNQSMVFLNNFAKSTAVSVGKVEGTEGNYTIAQMKNVSGLIKVTIASSKVESLEIESVGGEIVSGYVDVNYTKLAAGDNDFWTPTAGKTQNTKVSATPASNSTTTYVDGFFAPGTYYLAVLPQTYTSGLRVKAYGKDGALLVEKTIGKTSGITVKRSEIIPISTAIDADMDFLPETVTINLSFNNAENVNPFGFGNLLQADEDNTNGETYSFDYSYTYSGISMVDKFPFVICRGTSSGSRYRYTALSSMLCATGTSALLFDKDCWWIKLPAIGGRVLKSVTISHGNTTAKQVQVKTGPAGAVYGYTSRASDQVASSEALNTQTVSFPNSATGKSTVEATSYYLYGTASYSASIRIYNITLVYAKSL